jgi:HAD superfamily hydrolase (TIGR01459 family)
MCPDRRLMVPPTLDGVGAVAAGFDLFLVDQYGVLHDGVRPYPGAVAALAALPAAGKRTIVLTNSGKRSAPNAARLAALGFAPDSLFAVLSSGEIAWRGIRDGVFGEPFAPGRRAYVVGKPGDDYGLGDFGLSLVAAPEEAAFILIYGSDAPRTSLADYRARLAPAAAAGIPALCSNPDKLMLAGGGLQPAPGAIADIYAGLGGSVVYTGKPYPIMYEAARRLAPDVPDGRILVVGDSLEHDIRGGRDAGFATMLVRTGILADTPDAMLPALAARYGAAPDFIVPAFRWGESASRPSADASWPPMPAQASGVD